MFLKRIIVASVFISLSFFISLSLFAIGEGIAQQGGTGLGDEECPNVSNCAVNKCIPSWGGNVKVDCVLNAGGACVCP